MHCGVSVRELYGVLAFHSTTFSHLHTSHITVSFIGLPHLQLYPVKLQAENARGRGYVGYQMFAGICGAMHVLILGSLYTLCVATAAGKASKHLEVT